MLLNLLNKVPFINSITYFNWKVHRVALPKFLFLTIFNISPLMISVVLFPIEQKPNVTFWDHVVKNIELFFSYSEIYIYVATFITPILYILFERYQQQEFNPSSLQSVRSTIRTIYDGYILTALLAWVLVFSTLTGFSYLKFKSDTKSTNLYYLAISKIGWFCFLYSIYCFYLSILDSIGDPNSYTDSSRSDEEAFREQFSRRIDTRGNQ